MSKSTTILKKPLKQSRIAWKPHDYQKKAIKFMLAQSCAGLFLDPGLGKTSISLAALKVLKNKGMIGKVLIIAPLRVCYSVWPQEIEKWDSFEDFTYAILHGKDKEKNLEKEVDIYLINPEGLQWLLKNNLKKLGFDVLILDESSKFKDTNTVRFRLLKPTLPHFRRRYILTGSPAPNGLMDLFGQIYVLDCGAALGPYVSHYRNDFFYRTGYGGHEWRIQSGADKRIQERIKPLTLRLAAEDYLELPQMIINRIDIDLPPEARKVYKEMEDELIAMMENDEIVAANAAVASGKCSQIANGGLYDENHKAYEIHRVKAEVVSDIIEELGGTPALVAYEFQHDLERLLDALGKNTPYIGGGVSAKRSAAIEQAWNAGEIPVLLGQPASIAHGLNLQNAGNHVIWHSIPWNYEHYDQFNRRILRQGSKHKKVFVHHIIARDTIDQVKLIALNRKYRVQNDLFDALKEFLKKR